MTRAVRDRILKDVNGNISDHLRNHIHLTNCIHLKNHMHKHSPILGDRALMRDLVVLQRSRSLRDPSASPPSWHSPPVVDVLLKRGERADLVNGRRSVGIERPKQGGGMLTSSPVSKGSTGQMSRQKDGAAAAVRERSSKDCMHERRRSKREESSVRPVGNDLPYRNNDPPRDGNNLARHSVSGNSALRDKAGKKKIGSKQNNHLRTISDQLKDGHAESDDAVLSCNAAFSHSIDVEGLAQEGKIVNEAEAYVHSHGNSMNRVKRRRFRGMGRNRPSMVARNAVIQNEMSVASNSFEQGRDSEEFHIVEGVHEYNDQNVTGVPKNGCSIPWNWSRIHDRGKSFLDMAGRSLSCGLTDPRLKKGGQRRGIPDIAGMSEHSSSSTKSEREAFPLLFGASGSQGSIDHGAWHHDYSGELGIFADNLLKLEIDSDLASEDRSREQHKFRMRRNNRHRSLAQKYMPRTFRDLVGQNLVVQALSNAILKKKVGLLYVFYGPHGTGKTSCARVFARALNCQSLEHPKPCGFCNSCIAHDLGKSRNVMEIGPISNIDFDSIIGLLDNLNSSHLQSQYRVFIFDDCDTLSSDCWRALLKVIDRSPRRVVFVLICSSLDVLPHIIISRCQKFFFPKLKDADIIYTLQWIATKEDLEIDKDALKLIASRSDGSLTDAEMTLEQLSLLGQRISLALVQELVGLISDEKLVDLLDLALSADTVNTVKNLRDIMESGIEPLALMSQLATVITDILAGSYDFMKERPRRKFFRRQALSKEDMEKLRQALKTLSEAEKQLRVSNDRITWLTAALLQLAPDQQYMLPSSSANTSINHSPLIVDNAALRERPWKSNAETTNVCTGTSSDFYLNSKMKSTGMDGTVPFRSGMVSQLAYNSNDKNQINNVQLPVKFVKELDEIWLAVLEKIPSNSIKEFMFREAKLLSLSYGAAPTVQLLFHSDLSKAKAENFRSHILQAFETVLRSPVTIEIRCESKNVGAGPIVLPASQEPSHLDPARASLITKGMIGHSKTRRLQNIESSSAGVNVSEIVELEASPVEYNGGSRKDDKIDSHRRNIESALVRGGTSTQKTSTVSFPDEIMMEDKNQNLSLVKSKVSLAHVIQQAEGSAQRNGWSQRKAVSIAEKLEQENLRLEPRSRGLLCWNRPRVTRRKLSRLKIRTRKPQTLIRFVSCGRCLSTRSPR